MLRYALPTAVLSSVVEVFAQTGTAPASGAKGAFDPTFILMMVAMFAIIYFLMLRPQQKKQRELQNMLNNIKKGDKVLTVAGIVGIVGNVKDSSVMVKVPDNTVLEFKKSAITSILTDEKEGKTEPSNTGKDDKQGK